MRSRCCSLIAATKAPLLGKLLSLCRAAIQPISCICISIANTHPCRCYLTTASITTCYLTYRNYLKVIRQRQCGTDEGTQLPCLISPRIRCHYHQCQNPGYDSDTTFNSVAVVSVSNPKGILTPDTNRLLEVLELNSPLRSDTD